MVHGILHASLFKSAVDHCN